MEFLGEKGGSEHQLEEIFLSKLSDPIMKNVHSKARFFLSGEQWKVQSLSFLLTDLVAQMQGNSGQNGT